MPKHKTQQREFINVPYASRGAYSELKATTWLLERGFDVFRNQSANGRFDLVIYCKKTDKFYGVDVKTGHYYYKKNGERVLSHSSSRYPNTMLLIVTPDGECVFIGENSEEFEESDLIQSDLRQEKRPPNMMALKRA